MNYVEPIRDKKQIDAIKRQLRGNTFGLRDVALWTLGINSGLRVSDLLGLNIGDVAGQDGRILARITLREQKTGKTKSFPISLTASRGLKEYLDVRHPFEPSAPLFLSRKENVDGHLQRGQAYTLIKEAATAVGVRDNVGTHTMRKTFAYHAIKSGTDIMMVMKLLNHSSPAVTLAYAGITQDELDEVYLNLNL